MFIFLTLSLFAAVISPSLLFFWYLRLTQFLHLLNLQCNWIVFLLLFFGTSKLSHFSGISSFEDLHSLDLGSKIIIITWSSKYVNLETVVEDDSKTRFLIATTPGINSYYFQGFLNFTLDLYLIMLRLKQGGTQYHFWVFDMTRPGIEPRSPGPLTNTLPYRPMGSTTNSSILGLLLHICSKLFKQLIYLYMQVKEKWEKRSLPVNFNFLERMLISQAVKCDFNHQQMFLKCSFIPCFYTTVVLFIDFITRIKHRNWDISFLGLLATPRF